MWRAAVLMLGLAGCSFGFTSRGPVSQQPCDPAAWPPLVDATTALLLGGAGAYMIVDGQRTHWDGGDVARSNPGEVIGGTATVAVAVGYAVAATVGTVRVVRCRAGEP